MAAYAATVTVPDVVAKKIAATGLGILRGSVALSNYNSTLAEITGITNMFRSAPTVVAGGCSSNGYIVAWDTTSKAFKAWYPSKAQTHNHDLLIIGGQAEGTTDIINAANAAASLGKEEATNLTIAKANVATKGGVVSETLAAAAGTEVANDVNVGTIQFFAIGPAP